MITTATLVTTATLARLNACPSQVNLFMSAFPAGAQLTAANIEIAVIAGLDVEWLLWAPVEAQVEALRAPVRAQVEALQAPVEAQVEALWAPVRAQVGALWAPVEAQVEALWAPVEAQVGALWAPARAQVEAQVEALYRGDYGVVATYLSGVL